MRVEDRRAARVALRARAADVASWGAAAARDRRSISDWLRVAAEKAMGGGKGQARARDTGLQLNAAGKWALKALRALHRQDPRKWGETLGDLHSRSGSKMPRSLYERLNRLAPPEVFEGRERDPGKRAG